MQTFAKGNGRKGRPSSQLPAASLVELWFSHKTAQDLKPNDFQGLGNIISSAEAVKEIWSQKQV